MIFKYLQRKIKSLFLLLFLLFSSSVEALKVITSNLLHEQAYTTYLKAPSLKVELDHRNKKFKEFLNREKADIICLQEFHADSWGAVVKEFAQENDYTLLEELKPDDRDGLKTRLGILTNNKTIQLKDKTYTNKHGRIMTQHCIDKITNQEFVVFNIHAPWGQGGKRKDQTAEYKKCIRLAGNLPIIAVGDWNTDGTPEENKNKKILLETVFAATDGFEDISNSLPHTARSVNKMDETQKIDYIVTRGFKKPGLVITEPPHSPQGFNLLLPHTDNSNGASSFDPHSPDNHWSDHAAVIVDFDTAQQPATIQVQKTTPITPQTVQIPKTTQATTTSQPTPEKVPENTKNDRSKQELTVVDKPADKPMQKKPGFALKGKVLLGATGISMAYAIHKICAKKLKGKEFSALKYLTTFVMTFGELATFKHSMKKSREQKIFTTALTALIGGGIALNRA